MDYTTESYEGASLEVTEFASHLSVITANHFSNVVAEADNRLLIKYFDALSGWSNGHQIFELLDKYICSCDEQIECIISNLNQYPIGDQRYNFIAENLDWLQNERDTWQLVRILYRDRLDCELENKDIEPLSYEEGKIISDRTLVEKYYEKDATIRQCQLICDWLESVAAQSFDSVHGDKVEFFADHAVAWENTLHHLHNKNGINNAANMVTELDPDAPVRQNRALHDLDKEDDFRLIKYLMAYIRCGKIDEAENLCLRVGQPWRAAILEGWRLYHDPNFDAESELQPVEGNPYRDVWKEICAKASVHPGLDTYERAIYGILSGNIEPVIAVCKSRHDLLWAHLKVFIDHRVEQYLRDASQSLRELRPIPVQLDDKMHNLACIFTEMKSLVNPGSQSGYFPSSGPNAQYEELQENIILDDTSDLMKIIKLFVACYKDKYLSILRFIVHFILFLKGIGRVIQEETFVEVIHCYVKVLIKSQGPEVVSWYVSHLPEALQIETFTSFLESVTDLDDCQAALACAKSHGLPVHKITKTLVETIRKQESLDLVGPDLNPETSSEDLRKIKSLNWLMYDPSQREEAMLQTNSLIRQFLLVRKMDAAKQAYKKLPADSISEIMKHWKHKSNDVPMEVQNAIKEYLCFDACLSASDAFADWVKLYHGKPIQRDVKHKSTFTEKVAQQQEEKQHSTAVHQWQDSLKISTKLTKERLYNILLFPNGGWLVDIEVVPGDDARKEELEVLRKLCIPQIFSLLVKVLTLTNQSRELLQLHDILVAPEKGLMDLFHKDATKLILQQIKDTSIKLLMEKCDELGFPTA